MYKLKILFGEYLIIHISKNYIFQFFAFHITHSVTIQTLKK